MNELISFLDGQRDACLYHASASPKRQAWKWEQKAERYRHAAQEIARAETLRGELDAFLTWWSTDHTADPMSAMRRLMAIRDDAQAHPEAGSACSDVQAQHEPTVTRERF